MSLKTEAAACGREASLAAVGRRIEKALDEAIFSHGELPGGVRDGWFVFAKVRAGQTPTGSDDLVVTAHASSLLEAFDIAAEQLLLAFGDREGGAP